MRLSRAVAVTVLLGVLATSAASAAVDLTTTVVTLPLTSSGSGVPADELFVDSAHNHLFVSGVGQFRVVELSTSGQVVATRNVKDGVGGFALIGNSLYVGSCQHPVITQFTASTFTEVRTFTVGTTPPCRLTAGAGKLWFSPKDAPAALFAVTLGTTPKTRLVTGGINGGRSAFVAPSTLYVIAGNALEKIDVSGTTPVMVASTPIGGIDLAVSPDGSTIAVTQFNAVTQLFDSNLNPTSTLPAARAVAFSSDGNWIDQWQLDGTLDVYAAGSTSPTMSDYVGGTGTPSDGFHGGRHVAFSPDSSTAYVVAEDGAASFPTHAVLHMDTMPASDSFATFGIGPSPSTISTVGTQAAVSQVIRTVPGGGAVGRTVDGVLTDPNGNSSSAGSVTTVPDGPDGIYSFQTPALNLTGRWTLHLTVEASGSYRGFTVDAPIQVNGQATVAQLTRSAASLIYGNSETLTAHLTTYQANVTHVEIHKVSHGTDTVIASGPVDANGDLQTTFTPAHSAKYYAEHPSDDTYDPASSSQYAVGVVPIISGKWDSRHGTSGSYALFRYHGSCATSGSKCPQFTEHMVPAEPGMTVYLVVQAHTSSGWRSVAAWHKKLNSDSSARFSVRYGNASVIGHKYRLIAASKKTADLDASGWGYWYFKITN